MDSKGLEACIGKQIIVITLDATGISGTLTAYLPGDSNNTATIKVLVDPKSQYSEEIKVEDINAVILGGKNNTLKYRRVPYGQAKAPE